MNTNIIELLKENKLADNDFRASAIANGCKLYELRTDEERLARARLYRDWRVSQIFGNKTAPCFEKAIKGEAVPVDNMFTIAPQDEAQKLVEAVREEVETQG